MDCAVSKLTRGEDVVWQSRDRFDCWQPDENFAPLLMRGPVDCLRRDFGLEDRRYWLRLARQAALRPIELRCVQRRQLYHRDVHVAAVVNQFTAERIAEPAQRMLRGTVGGLQGDAAIGEGGTDLHDAPTIARLHPSQGRKRAVNRAQVCHLGHAAEFLRGHLFDRREDADHRVIDPDVDRAQLPLDCFRRRFDLLRVGDVERQDERATTCGFDFTTRGFQSISPTSEQTNVYAAFRKLAHRRTTDTGRGAGNDDDLAPGRLSHARN